MKRAAAALRRLLLLVSCATLSHGSSSLLRQHETSLDGYAFQCEKGNGDNVGSMGFRASNEVFCMNYEDYEETSSDRMPCGHYSYNNGVLTGFSTLMGSFRAHHIERRDGMVVSFLTEEQVSCRAVSLDWTQYSHDYFLGLSCPPAVDGSTITQNHFTFGLTGDIALRSVVSSMKHDWPEGSSSAAADNVTYDYYGIFQYHEENQNIKMYFGPQRDRDTSWILQGFLTRGGKLVLDDSEVCVHDGQSRIRHTDTFVKQLSSATRKKAKKLTSHRQAWDSTVIAVGHFSATTAAALGVSVTLDKRAPAYGLVAGWGLKAVADGVSKKLNCGKKYLSKTLQKGAMVQRMLCVAGSAVCVAASAASVLDVMSTEQLIERFRRKKL